MDGELEPKTFAPGYGEHSSGTAPDNFEATAFAVPADALPGPVPDPLKTLLTGSRSVFRAARAGDWTGAAASVAAMNAAWVSFQAVNPPPLLQPLMAEALADLTQAVAGQHQVESRQAAFDVLRNALDFSGQYRPRVVVDFRRIALWGLQLEIDVQARDRAGVKSDLVILDWIVSRLEGAGSNQDQVDLIQARRRLADIRDAAARGDWNAIEDGARRLQGPPLD